ncbi:uncharacterized protein At2g39920-like [Mangifera indica]|uniref:uncharacterized protein At2g39920-like n=1 Tax=Mangifera indica TaxID=29780 RepID=UPI001CFC0F59|nr:uncharacterized protein At2g39920-like [Mangifera indica]
MSAYGHEMEREYSIRSLESRGGSELGSRYAVESGFYMTSFAATIFIGGLVTVGILLVTLLIALAVMLQSCQSSRAGVVEIAKASDDYSYCKMYALHAELNSLEVEADYFPSVCRVLAIQYLKAGLYTRDLNFTMWMIESYFSTLSPTPDGLDVVLLDIDYVVAPSPQCTKLLMDGIDPCGNVDDIKEANHLKQMLTLKLFLSLQASGWPVILISRKPEGQRNATTELLISAGYGDWASLIMRVDDEMQMDSRGYISRQRTILQEGGFRITCLISCQMDALMGPNLGKRVFKLPNPLYYDFQRLTERKKLA